jgi:hypothetical protein
VVSPAETDKGAFFGVINLFDMIVAYISDCFSHVEKPEKTLAIYLDNPFIGNYQVSFFPASEALPYKS